MTAIQSSELGLLMVNLIPTPASGGSITTFPIPKNPPVVGAVRGLDVNEAPLDWRYLINEILDKNTCLPGS
jgi:hypothetical protein